MASSEIMFRGKTTHIRDAAIGTFLDSLQEEIASCERREEKQNNWLESACKTWQEIWNEMPPGCKDIELDAFLTTLERQKSFYILVDKILQRIKHEIRDPEVLIREITKISALLQT